MSEPRLRDTSLCYQAFRRAWCSGRSGMATTWSASDSRRLLSAAGDALSTRPLRIAGLVGMLAVAMNVQLIVLQGWSMGLIGAAVRALAATGCLALMCSAATAQDVKQSSRLGRWWMGRKRDAGDLR